MKYFFFVLGTIFFCCTATTSAGIGLVCGDYMAFVNSLQKQYQETSRGKGFSGSGTLIIELFTSARGTWTILTTQTQLDGKTCLTSAGAGWTDSIQKPIGVPL